MKTATADLVNNVAKSMLKKLESDALASSAQFQYLRDPLSRVSQMLESGVDAEKVTQLVNEADDLVDEAATHFAKSSNSKVCYHSFASSSCGKEFQFGRKMGRKIERVCEELVELGQSGSDLDNQSVPYPETEMVETPDYSPMDDVIIGRDREKEEIVIALLDTSNQKDDISVVTIVGTGGLGKTTLAQLVYNDERVADHFDLRLWVCVGDNFNIRTIIGNIVTRCLASTKPTVDGLELDRLTALLQAAITDKVFLLVLDDVWNRDRVKWLSLESTLAVGARGSRILVTTRSKYVAQTIRCPRLHSITGLSTDASWQIFSRIAFGHQEPPEHLIQLAQKFLHHCIGVPLAIVVGARCLQSKRNEDEWKDTLATLMISSNVQNKNARDKKCYFNTNILEQSYNHLPSPLKACFAYLSLFPSDFEFNTLDVVSLWQAQGFLETAAPDDEDQSMEDLGEAYCSFLAHRAFLTELKCDQYMRLTTFKMHDLMYDLALNAAEGWEKIHASLIHERDPRLVQQNLVDSHKLRTFLSCVALEDADRMIRISEVVKLSKFKSLRVLDLHGFGIQTLPDSIGNLIHLRYLDLSHNQPLVKLPNSITNLYNLQTLKLNCCYDLQKLPTYTKKLACLRRLEIDGCEKLTYMPPGFENLTSLRILSRYVVGRPRFQCISGFQSLGNLNRLQGRLVIELSDNWTAAVNEVAKSNLSSKTRLTELAIKWGSARRTSETDSNKHQTALDGLQPPSNLKMLHIEGYRGPDFPRWAKANTFATALPELVTVSIDGSGQCKTLPPFSRLPHLRRLTLRFMDNVQFFENSDNQSSTSESQFFPALEELTLHSFYCLERWCEDETLVSSLSFDCLKKLKLWSCPKLESMPLFPDVEVLDLQNINKKLLKVPNVPSSSSSDATNSVPIGHPQNLPLLKTLHVKGCPRLKTLTLGKNSGKLRKLVVERLDMLSSLTEVLKQITSLEELEISSCRDLDLSGGCQSTCGECDECGMPWQSLSTLRRLTLRELPQLKSLPAGLGIIGTLETICISACNNLSVLPKWVSKFTSLQHLRLEGCPALSMLPKELKGIHSLVKVDIIECPKLMERCRKGGEDWHKIKHARVLCHKSWRYALMSEAKLPQKPKNQGKNIVVHSEDPTIRVNVTIRRPP